MKKKLTTLECIKKVLKTINNHFENDMGALDLVDFSNNILTLSFRGACVNCKKNNRYLKAAIEEMFREIIPSKEFKIKYLSENKSEE